jgi:hypothetical protein
MGLCPQAQAPAGRKGRVSQDRADARRGPQQLVGDRVVDLGWSSQPTVNFVSPLLNVGTSLTVGGGTADFSRPDAVVLPELNLTGGTLTGTSLVTVTGPLTWTAGDFSGSGRTVAEGGLTISGSATKNLIDRTLENAADAVLTGAGVTARGVGAFVNDAGASFTVQGIGLRRGRFDSLGTLRVLTSGEFVQRAFFDSSGTVDLAPGAALDLDGGGTGSGTFLVEGGLSCASGVGRTRCNRARALPGRAS